MKAAKEARSASSGAASETEASGSGLVEKERKRQEAELHALDVLMLPKGDTKQRNFKCVGWRSTGGCSPHGPREPDNDFNCIKLIPFGHSGYCEVEDTETGELFRVMRRYCSSTKYDTSFRCSDATNFINFRRKAREAADKAFEPGFTLPNMNETDKKSSRDGIVMVVYPKLIASAYATIKTLRDVLGCRLPIEIWFRRAEMNGYAGSFKPLETLAADNATSFITFHEITDWHAVGFGTKVFAIYNSHFERVLFLDADNVPTRDPAFLFESQEFVDTGAVFWPDFWLPTRTIFNIHSQSLVWELLDMPFVNMFEQESGQLLIDRRRHTEALELVKFYTFHRPSLFDNMKLVHGDKDLFRFAWLKLDTPFHMIQAAPAIAGKIINESFCGLTMVQHDVQGEVLFLHRNSHKLMGELLREPLNYKARAINRSRKKADIRKKARLEGKPIPNWSELDALVQADETPPPTLEPAEPDGYPDSVVWTHLLSFNNSANRTNYVIETYNADPEFPKSQNCYGQRNVSKNEYFYAQDVADLSFAGIETDLRSAVAVNQGTPALTCIHLAQLQEKETQIKKRSAEKKGNRKLNARLRCLGWRATGDCNPDGPRRLDLDLSCSKAVPYGQSGYCELEDKDTGEIFHVLKRNCNSVRADARFRCLDASDFVKFPIRAEDVAQKALAPGFALPHVVPRVPGVNTEQSGGRDGIVMVVYPKLLPSTYATVRTLRDVLGCRLPIELWFRPEEMKMARKALEPLKTLAASDTAGGISFHEIDDPRAVGYGTKVFAIYHSFLERVLFLDADNVPVRDPTFLFESQEFVDNGAVFWPDFWHSGRTIFNIHSQSLVWQLLGLPFVDMFEQESGQLLIDRRRHAAPMEVLFFYSFHLPNHFDNFKLVHGDKDLFRFAWMQQNASFHMIQAPPAVAGKVVSGNFCGMTMVQHDPAGEVLFMHRNSHKLTGVPKRLDVNVKSAAVTKAREKLAAQKSKVGYGRLTPKRSEVEAEIAAMTPAPTLEASEPDGYPDAIIWTHLLSFNSTAARADYVIETYNADPEFSKEQHCYGQRHIGSNPSFYAQEIANLSFAGLETNVRRFAMEAAQLR
ncbi:hypothetical protein BBO99_00007552 [Phytophthora kernoviae]|uniref:Nucleotide-diphospho-sugar transferase domain-containing protein n=1 Tax=Phytophthora kernoviae TaxID=325452 RepID=A0A3R7J529_9STRA|nr:hypothetical protein JM16_007382 [Phytophthora kernoviae]KAG2519989.1 hypothetical protein JM18_007115 [Phytophthora kernoviae]RLN05671.1 hypothetical protein BBI17_007498 [Phytophthora kernoviae]RLN76447.1 hypothetical protein BBO99_00007552 [Phytophthora kernoviae]